MDLPLELPGWLIEAVVNGPDGCNHIERYPEYEEVAYAFVVRDKPSARQLIRSRA